MSADPYAAYYTPPEAELRPLEKPHAGLGIASFLIALLVGAGELVLVGWAGYTEATHPGSFTAESPVAILTGLMMFAGLAFVFVGAALGIGGLFQENRKRVFAILGLTFNLLIVVGFVALVLIGLAVK